MCVHARKNVFAVMAQIWSKIVIFSFCQGTLFWATHDLYVYMLERMYLLVIAQIGLKVVIFSFCQGTLFWATHDLYVYIC